MKFLVTAGPTREKIDPVRFITNYSSGRMGYALAAAAQKSGHEVLLISGPVALPCPDGVTLLQVESAAEMAQAVHNHVQYADVIIMAAAVADYRPANPEQHKMKKMPGDLVLKLEHTEDILASLGKCKRDNQLLIGFAAETDDLEQNALGKLSRKNLDWIAANWVADGFGTNTNSLILFSRHGKRISLGSAGKDELAEKMLQTVLE
jgi:phosphopantothenoylcysteine decarboxylase/phosphopantothenate--cysteine ligase